VYLLVERNLLYISNAIKNAPFHKQFCLKFLWFEDTAVLYM